MIEKNSLAFRMEGDLYRWKSKWWNTIDKSTEKWGQMYDEGEALIRKYDGLDYVRRTVDAFYFRCYAYINGKEPEKYNGRVVT